MVAVQGVAVAVAVAVGVTVGVAVSVGVAVKVAVDEASGVWVRKKVGVVLNRDNVELKAQPPMSKAPKTPVMRVIALF